ncbi:MAG: MEKHLA domain-containing protein [Candidatus Methanoperedens sp.]|nr:MEKHLA domain-containing protein [Candidatus Methanoperedens sp.]MCE8428972.1 MEKHLA domain-containing protein [Candidatus Methanoperedens sp.]
MKSDKHEIHGIASMEAGWKALIKEQPLLIDHVHRLLQSFRCWTGRELIHPSGSKEDRAEALFQAPFVVLSHGIQEDPILNYGNQAALTLWEMTWTEFTNMPSRLTAEPVNRKDRARLLDQVKHQGYTDAYRGVRISRSGRKFLVEQATVWNIMDSNGQYAGQAATFDRWTIL